MRPGDLIVTPCWTSHEHGNPGKTPVVWLDGLDVPIVNLFDSSFAGSVPPGEADPPAKDFAYPYAENREALERLAREWSRRFASRRQNVLRHLARLSNAHDVSVPAASAARISGASLGAQPTPRCTAPWKGRGALGQLAIKRWNGRSMTCS